MTAPDPALARLHAAVTRLAEQAEQDQHGAGYYVLDIGRMATDELAAVVAERDAARALLSEWAPLAWAGPTLNADSRCESCWRRLRVEDGIKNSDPAKHEPNCRWVRTAAALAPAGARNAGKEER